MPENVQYYSEEGLKKLMNELDHLKNHERPSISGQIAEARDKGDLSENAEYAAAKEAQGMLEQRIAKLEIALSNARVMDAIKIDHSKVLILSSVNLRNISNKKNVTYKLVSQNEADLKTGKLSIESPIGRALLGKKTGDVVEVNAPSGKLKFKILNIKR